MFSSFTKKTIIFLMLFSFVLTMGLAISEQQILPGTDGVSESLAPMAYAAEGDAEDSDKVTKNASSDNGNNESTSTESTADTENNDWAVSDWMYNNISIIVITVLGVLMCIYLYFSNRQK